MIQNAKNYQFSGKGIKVVKKATIEVSEDTHENDSDSIYGKQTFSTICGVRRTIFTKRPDGNYDTRVEWDYESTS